MPNYNYRSQFNYSFSAKPVVLRGKITFGASGAPTLVSGTGMGITSVVRNSAGTYTIDLGRAFTNLMAVDVMPVAASAPAAPVVRVAADNVASASLHNLQIVFSVAAGTATDPASGEAVLIEIVLNDSSLAY